VFSQKSKYDAEIHEMVDNGIKVLEKERENAVSLLNIYINPFTAILSQEFCQGTMK